MTAIQKIKALALGAALAALAATALGQLPDKTKTPNVAGEGINKSLIQQIGAGRGDVMTPNSSAFIIARDPFRAIRRGRQLFQRKFLRSEGIGPLNGDGAGDINVTLALGAGLTDNCAACHGRPRGSAGVGGVVATRPDSRDAPHLFGLGLREMLADEITADLRAIRAQAIAAAAARHRAVTRRLDSKGINFGSITARPDATVDTSEVEGVDADLRIRPFFAQGGTISIREFTVGAFNDEMGLQAVDPDLTSAAAGHRVVTPSGLVLDGATDQIKPAPAATALDDPDGDGVANELPASLIDFMEFYLLNYFQPATYEQNIQTAIGRKIFERIGCAVCHVPDLVINRDRRVANVETVYDAERGIFNNLFATAIPLFGAISDDSGFPAFKRPRFGQFVVKNIFTDFKRHDLGPNFHERNYDGSIVKEFLTRPLWGVGTTAPYGHDGRSVNLTEVILRHGGEAQAAQQNFRSLPYAIRGKLLDFLNTLIIFPPEDTASNLDPGDRYAQGFPQFKHGSIRLTTLFNDPTDIE
ncbi:MAG: di-heme oxidoredictase family protein [Blastocatellales bacterium]